MSYEIKDLDQEDTVRVIGLHAESTFDYGFPADFWTPRWPLKRAVYSEGQPVLTAALKVQAECYLWLDHSWSTPEERWEALKRLHRDATEKAKIIGYDQLFCVLPPEVAKSFGPRLKELGWAEARPWPPYTLDLR